ncbi:hypothetical protein PpBr36_08456 [Pyricularia pennisetigena]|uniref:hypothetical protein n=1 Tax=Pyricularia pennisetigena TaxID=1578925 RepID=UPI00114F7FD0|nr:hypothetical protein PpBr36_08456 [Pyricularia pennisetigena]TLS24412.1 hypothetical protein PpBr36_08456 [Pyricularia pennisetigena]
MSVFRSGPRSALGLAAKWKCTVSTGVQIGLLPLSIYQKPVPISAISLGAEKSSGTLQKVLYSTAASTRSSMDNHPQDELHAHSLADPVSFWGQQAEHLYWHKKPSAILNKSSKKVLDGDSEVSHPHWEWFPGGEISTCYNCLDRHVEKGNGDAPAIFYDSPVTATKQRLSYKELLEEVAMFAAVLRQEGVRKGDVVLVYRPLIDSDAVPMIPAALIGILAINRLGAIHSVVFGGFASGALAQRIDASRPVAILTASCGIEAGKGPLAYRNLVKEAVANCKWKPSKTIVWQREQLRWEPVRREDGERIWHKLVSSAKARKLPPVECVPVGSSDPIYIIYTSGTTGLPKGVVRDSGGHAVGLHLSINSKFGIHGPGDVMACFSDIGWVVSHSYTLYGPLITGAATVLYEGKPVGTPDAGAFWRIVEEYKVNSLFTAPTALRAIRKADPDSEFVEKYGRRGGLKSLRALFLAGERSEPAIVEAYQEVLDKHAAPDAHVIDNWWSTESGSPISGIALVPQHGKDGKTCVRTQKIRPLRSKPGSAGKPMPGFDVRVVNDEGEELPRGKMGNIVMATPLAPTAFRTLWNDEPRFFRGYFKRFNGLWVDTGDTGVIDEDGYVHIMSRSGKTVLRYNGFQDTANMDFIDDIINVAAHRLSTGTLEEAITSHPLVTEVCVVGIPDSLKGQMPFALVTTTPSNEDMTDEQLLSEIQQLIRKQVGAIAALRGIIRGQGMIPKTRSGKTLRRVIRELFENASKGEPDKEVTIPSTVEDAAVVEVARAKIKEYFERQGKAGGDRAPKAKL